MNRQQMTGGPEMAGTSSSGGRNKQSRAQHHLAGTLRADRHGTTPDPERPKGRPTRPRTLRGHGLAEWTRMVDRLERAQTLSAVDDAVLYQYCCLFAETEGILAAKRHNAALVTKLLAVIRQRQPKLRDEHVVDALAQIAILRALDAKHTTQLRQGHMALRQYLVEFGMTPAARSRVKGPAGPEEKDPFAEFDDTTRAH